MDLEKSEGINMKSRRNYKIVQEYGSEKKGKWS